MKRQLRILGALLALALVFVLFYKKTDSFWRGRWEQQVDGQRKREEELSRELGERLLRQFVAARAIAKTFSADSAPAAASDPEQLARLLAPFVPHPFQSVILFDDSGEPIVRVSQRRMSSEITEAERRGVDEAGLAGGSGVLFDAERRLIRAFEPIPGSSGPKGYLCFEIDLLPDDAWFVADASRILIPPGTVHPAAGTQPYSPGGTFGPYETTHWELTGLSGGVSLCRLRLPTDDNPEPAPVRYVVVALSAIAVFVLVWEFAFVRRSRE